MSDNSKKDPRETVKNILAAAADQARMAGSPDPLGNEPAHRDLSSLSPDELLEECAREPETDIGNARRFLKRYGDKVLHVARVGWHGFDGKRWKEDEDGSIVRPLAQRTAEWIHEEAIRLDATDAEKLAIDDGREALKERKKVATANKKWTPDELVLLEKLEKRIERMTASEKAVRGRMSTRYSHAKSSAGTTKINNMLTEASPHVAAMVNLLNTDLYAINTDKGTLRFIREENPDSDPDDPTYEWLLRVDPHRSSDLISKLAPVRWNGPCDAPVFDRFFKTVQPDPEVRAFLKRYFGYCLLGITLEQCLLFFYGAGRNGKSTMVELICDILGDYAVTLSIDSFAGEGKRGGNEATPDLARLPGARLVAASEPEMGVKLKDALIKTMTGGEKMPVRRLHQDFIEIDPQFKIVLQGNHKPRIDDNSDGIWRRVLLVPFEVQIARDQVDRDLPRKLRVEKEGVFAWLVQGALEYLNYGLNPPDVVVDATAEYREESDPIGAFIRLACEVTGNEHDSIEPGELFIGYTNYANREGLAEFKKVTFSRRFPDYARKMWTSPDDQMKRFWKAKSGNTVYRGIRVKSEYLRQPGSNDLDGYPR